LLDEPVYPQDSLLDLVTGLGAPHDKLIVSLPATVTQFKLTDAKHNTPRSRAAEEPVKLTQSEVSMTAVHVKWEISLKNVIIEISQFVFRLRAIKSCGEMEVCLHEFKILTWRPNVVTEGLFC
jgi:hypothetical protein